MALTQQMQKPAELVGQLGKDYATQLTGLTSLPLDTSKFAPQVAGQDALQTQAASLAASGVGGYAPYLTQAATYGGRIHCFLHVSLSITSHRCIISRI